MLVGINNARVGVSLIVKIFKFRITIQNVAFHQGGSYDAFDPLKLCSNMEEPCFLFMDI